MSAQAQRKAWNQTMLEAMNSTGKIKPSKTASSSSIPGMSGGILATAATTRSSHRHKRREKARKSTADTWDVNTMIDIRIDALEGIVGDGSKFEEEEEYINAEEGVDSGNMSKRKRSSVRGSAKNKKGGVIPKRLKPRSLASILIEESSLSSNVLSKYLEAEARPMNKDRNVSVTRKFCPVTGLFGVYKDPKSGIPYANLRALEQIQERAPPWMVLSGNAAYAEALRSLRQEE